MDSIDVTVNFSITEVGLDAFAADSAHRTTKRPSVIRRKTWVTTLVGKGDFCVIWFCVPEPNVNCFDFLGTVFYAVIEEVILGCLFAITVFVFG